MYIDKVQFKLTCEEFRALHYFIHQSLQNEPKTIQQKLPFSLVQHLYLRLTRRAIAMHGKKSIAITFPAFEALALHQIISNSPLNHYEEFIKVTVQKTLFTLDQKYA